MLLVAFNIVIGPKAMIIEIRFFSACQITKILSVCQRVHVNLRKGLIDLITVFTISFSFFLLSFYAPSTFVIHASFVFVTC